MGKGIKIESGFYSRNLVEALIEQFKMPPTNVKWFIPARKALKSDIFKNYLTAIFTMFPESQAKLLANSFMGELGRKYSRKDIMDLFFSQWIQLNGRQYLLRIVTSQLTAIRILTLKMSFS